MIKLYVVRHGRTDWNVKGIIQGTTDIPLNEEGRKQVKELAQKHDLESFDLCFSSPLKRTRETAEIIIGNKKEIILDRLLIERSYGEFEGNPIDYDLTVKIWTDLDEKMNGIESTRECLERAQKFLRKIKRDYPNKTILIVSHGGFIKALHFSIIGYDENTDFLSFKPENAKIYEYELD